MSPNAGKGGHRCVEAIKKGEDISSCFNLELVVLLTPLLESVWHTFKRKLTLVGHTFLHKSTTLLSLAAQSEETDPLLFPFNSC